MNRMQNPQHLTRFERAQRGALFRLLRAQFRLDWQGIHGVPHWTRVRHNGLLLAQETGADVVVVELFALLHDCQRDDDDEDPAHGPRAAEFALTLQGRHFQLADDQLERLYVAIAQHSDGLLHADPTIQTCWDADRLDLGRVGIQPDPRYLSWEAMAHTARAYAWSRGH